MTHQRLSRLSYLSGSSRRSRLKERLRVKFDYTLDKRPPFGVRVRRFVDVGIHPAFLARPGTYKYPNLFPGCYNWNKTPHILSTVPRWNRTLEVEKFSKQLGYQSEKSLKQRKWIKSINGPGWHDVNLISSVRDVTFPKGERFPKSKSKFSVPGPGTYLRLHVPFVKKEGLRGSKTFHTKGETPTPSFKPRSLNVDRPYYLPPNIYHVKTSIEELTSKVVSKRGPYDLFTGPRFPRILSVQSTERIPPVLQIVDLNDLSHHKNAFKGKFMRCGKNDPITSRVVIKDPSLCKKNPLDPGPNYYDPYSPKVVVQAPYPFYSSIAEVRPLTKWALLPPPGRYNTEPKKKIKGDGCKSAFVSKTKRGFSETKKYSWFFSS